MVDEWRMNGGWMVDVDELCDFSELALLSSLVVLPLLHRGSLRTPSWGSMGKSFALMETAPHLRLAVFKSETWDPSSNHWSRSVSIIKNHGFITGTTATEGSNDLVMVAWDTKKLILHFPEAVLASNAWETHSSTFPAKGTSRYMVSLPTLASSKTVRLPTLINKVTNTWPQLCKNAIPSGNSAERCFSGPTKALWIIMAKQAMYRTTLGEIPLGLLLGFINQHQRGLLDGRYTLGGGFCDHDIEFILVGLRSWQSGRNDPRQFKNWSQQKICNY